MADGNGSTWIKRVAKELAEQETAPSAALLEAALEAAGEMTAVRLKVLLAQCYEIIGHSRTTEKVANPDDDFLDEIKDAIR